MGGSTRDMNGPAYFIGKNFATPATPDYEDRYAKSVKKITTADTATKPSVPTVVRRT